jgi:hypothetical protein
MSVDTTHKVLQHFFMFDRCEIKHILAFDAAFGDKANDRIIILVDIESGMACEIPL